MTLHGTSIVGTETVPAAHKTFTAFNPKPGETIQPPFYEATEAQVDQALELATAAAEQLRSVSSDKIVSFLLAIPRDRGARRRPDRACFGRDRTRSRAPARSVGSYLESDQAVCKRGGRRLLGGRPHRSCDADRKPLPRVDIRRMLQPSVLLRYSERAIFRWRSPLQVATRSQRSPPGIPSW